MRRFAIVFLVLAIAILSVYSYRTYWHSSQQNNESNPPRNVYIITASGLRPGHLSSYMYGPIQTPAIDFLAYDGVRFTNAFTASTDSLAAHLSLLSGISPVHDPIHQTYQYLLDENKRGIAKGLSLLPEILSGKGYRTAAFLSDPELRYPAFFGSYFHQIFTGDRSLYPWESAYSSATVCKLARDWIQENKSRPQFLLLNFDEPTPPFQPPAPYNQQYANHLYDGEIAGLDEQIGLFMDLLKESGLFQKSIVVLTAPYGQTLDGDSRFYSPRDAVLQVPLMIAAPGLLPRHENYDAQVSIVDVLPTILKLLDSKEKPASDGLPLFEPGKDQQVHHSYVYGMVPFPGVFGFQPEYYLRATNHLYVTGEVEEVVGHDRFEISNAKRDQLIQADRNEIKKQAFKTENLPRSNLETDPAALLEQAWNLAREGKTAVALDLLQSFLENGPKTAYLNSFAGNLAEASGDIESALQFFKKATALAGSMRTLPDLARAEIASNMAPEALDALKRYKRNFPMMSYDVRSTYAVALSLTGHTEEALIEFGTVLRQNPRYAEAYIDRGKLWKKLGKDSQAETDWKKAIEVDSENVTGYSELAALSRQTGHAADGIPYLRQVIRLQPENYEVMLELALLHQISGHQQEARELCQQVLLNTQDPVLKEKAKRIFGQ